MKRWRLPIVILGVALIVAGAVSLFASQSPDGLERVAEDLGFASQEAAPPPATGLTMPDYALPGHPDAAWSHAVAGIAGTVIVLGIGLALGLLLRRRRPPGPN